MILSQGVIGPFHEFPSLEPRRLGEDPPRWECISTILLYVSGDNL